MTTLDDFIKKAYSSQGKPEDASRVYEALFTSELFLPCKKMTADEQREATEAGEPFIPLYTEQDDRYFLLAFDTAERLDEWAGEQRTEIDCFKLIGSDVIKALGDRVHFCLNFGTEHYKEFTPDEIMQLKSILQKQINQGEQAET